MKPAIVLLSGGLDSTTVAAHALKEGYDVRALTVLYGQQHSREAYAATDVANHLRIPHQIVNFPSYAKLAQFSVLTDRERVLPTGRTISQMVADIPITYVPLRNTFFVTLAAAALESWVLQLIEGDNFDPKAIESASIFVGANALDYAGYPDCRPEFYDAIARTIYLGSKIGAQYRIRVAIEAPIIAMTKVDIIRHGRSLDAPLDLTWSCYAGLKDPCGECDACLLRDQAFKEIDG